MRNRSFSNRGSTYTTKEVLLKVELASGRAVGFNGLENLSRNLVSIQTCIRTDMEDVP